MEFHAGPFTPSGAAALVRHSPRLLGERPWGQDDANSQDEDFKGRSFAAYDEFLQYPSDDSGSGPLVANSRRHSSRQSVEMLDPIEDDDNTRQHSDDSPDSWKPFFDLDMSAAIIDSYPRISPSSSPGFIQLEEGVLDTGLLLGERLDLVPSFYTYATKACLMPIRKVQHELINLYFQFIHPMFPVVDEKHFMELHRRYRGKEELMNPTDFLVYQAVIAAGFGHLSEAQLQRTPYRSVHEGQEAQFDLVKARYWSQPTDNSFVLTQICLIISLWSPGPAGVQNNSYWINLAFKHANDVELWRARPRADGRHCQPRLLWWCCLVRDRILALGMRRPNRLHRGPCDEKMISPVDFDLEAMANSDVGIHSKHIEMLAFIWLCKLSEIMAAIAVFQRRTKFSREWNGDDVGNTISELEEVTAFDQDIRKWKEDFETDAFEALRDQPVRDSQDIPTSFSILRIVCNSLVAVLYQPYLHLSWLDHPFPAEEITDPLQRMKEVSQAVESNVISLITSKKSDALPNWLVSWITLPVAVYYVHQHVKLNPSPDKVLMPFLNRFMRRTTGAQFLFLALTKALKEFLRRLNESNQASRLERSITPATDHLSNTNSAWNAGDSLVEAKILAHVTRSLDCTLEAGC